MGLLAVFGLLVSIPIGFLAVAEVNTLQDVSKPITTGAVNTLLGTTTFFMLLVVIVVCIGAVAAAVNFTLSRLSR